MAKTAKLGKAERRIIKALKKNHRGMDAEVFNYAVTRDPLSGPSDYVVTITAYLMPVR